MRVDFQTYKISKINQNNSLPQSVRVKSLNADVVSFGNNKDFLQLPQEEIIKRVESSLNAENLIGSGGEAKVYIIPDTEYCIRIPHCSPDEYKKGFVTSLTDLEKINHGVAKLGDKTIIMKRLEGYSMFPRKETGVTRAMVHSMIDDMPVSAYRKVIMQIAQAYKNGAYFDSSGANVIVNPVDKTMTIIDFTDSLDCANSRVLKTLFSTLGMNDGILTKAQQKDRASKIMLSVVDDFLPEKKPFMPLMDYTFSDLIYAVKNQGLIDKPYCELFIRFFDELREWKYAEIRGVKDIHPQMFGRVKQIKSLIKQLLT